MYALLGSVTLNIFYMQRKYDSLESERETRADDSQVLWRVNFEEFLHRFRHKVCILFQQISVFAY